MDETKTLAKVYDDAMMDGQQSWPSGETTARHLRGLGSVAAHVRAEDAARGGTLSAEEFQTRLGGACLGVAEDAQSVATHAAAQGRTIAARDARIAELEALSVGHEDNAHQAIRERDEALAELAKAAELLDAAGVPTDADEREKGRTGTLPERVEMLANARRRWQEQCRAAESALATLQQRVEQKQAEARARGEAATRGTGDVAERNASRAWGEVDSFGAVLRMLDATPSEHPDTATLRDLRAKYDALAEAAAPYLTHDGEAWVSHVNPDDTATLRGIRERAGDRRGLVDAYMSETGSGSKIRAMVEFLLGDSGPSGGDELRSEPTERCGRCGAALVTMPTRGKVCWGCRRPESLCACPEKPGPSGGGEACNLCGSTGSDECGHGQVVASWGEPTTQPGAAAPVTCAMCGKALNIAAGEAMPGHWDALDEMRCKPCHDREQVIIEGPDFRLTDVGNGYVRQESLPPTPTPEEDWRTVEDWVEEFVPTTEEGSRELAEVKAALARLKAEPRRAAEAMRERCAAYIDPMVTAGLTPDVREAAKLLALGIRALPLD